MTEGKNITEPFRIPASTYLRISLLKGRMKAAGVVVAAIYAVAALAAGMVDIRYGLVALMIALVVAPMILAIYLLSQMMRPEAVNSSLMHRVEIQTDGSIEITYEPDPDMEYKLPPKEHIEASSITELSHTGEYTTIGVGGKKPRFIIFKTDELQIPDILSKRLSEYN